MASKIFVDANFLLEITLRRENFNNANQIMKMAIEGNIRLFTSPSVLHIVSYFTAKAYSISQTREILLTLLNDVFIIECDHATALIALNSKMDDIEDALLYYTALKFEMDYFISADKRLKKQAIPQLPVYTTLELLSELQG